MDLDDRSVFLLSQLGRHIADRFAGDLAPLGLNPAHFGVLVHLRQVGRDGQRLSQQQLADRLRVHRNAMVGLVDDLESRGLVRRERHPDDRRAHAVELTERGHDVLTQAESVADTLEDAVLAPLTDAEHAQLAALLRRLTAHAELPPGVHPGLHRRQRRSSTSP
ncbi:MarR family winged helix-turn-helix transcriptional regulator [Actinomadura rupiterrae]|uniref:MarR family winged helix-turn-helix transcriptional regulator n=1 Tax=Actinomadura rupiterrae TaxID=559627 RepID=UPI0020A256B0|nr:MarR family transcriptional regulator [Actinomadura rupiterrae]MCP2341395.1 DNA-binding MarR family transcriptional regulator [Actinomadura rupiterrae]